MKLEELRNRLQTAEEAPEAEERDTTRCIACNSIVEVSNSTKFEGAYVCLKCRQGDDYILHCACCFRADVPPYREHHPHGYVCAWCHANCYGIDEDEHGVFQCYTHKDPPR